VTPKLWPAAAVKEDLVKMPGQQQLGSAKGTNLKEHTNFRTDSSYYFMMHIVLF
jgi:hypothetical protein